MNDPQPEGQMASYIGRRKFLAAFGGAAAAWPLVARAQQPERIRRIGVLMAVAESDADVGSGIALFQQSLQELGWKDGRNIRIDYRWGDADAEPAMRLSRRQANVVEIFVASRQGVQEAKASGVGDNANQHQLVGEMFRRSSAAVATSREGHRSPRSGRVGQHRRPVL